MTITVIEKAPWKKFITVQSGYTEDDGEFVVEDCNHAGAEEQELWGGYDDDNDYMVLVCDKCHKQFDPWDGSWND